MDMTGHETAKKYADIINALRPTNQTVLAQYPPLPEAERAKIFAPYAALRGREDRLDVEDEKLLLQQRIALSQEEQEALSQKLTNLKKGAAVRAFHFVPSEYTQHQDLGAYAFTAGIVTRLDWETQSV